MKMAIVLKETGELVITEPLPSMPIFFWGDESFEKYNNSYFNENQKFGLMEIGYL